MSLVDYASSSSDEEENEEAEEGGKPDEFSVPQPPLHPSLPPPTLDNQISMDPSHQCLNAVTPLPSPSIERLPDASLLLSSLALPSNQVIHGDHNSRVAAAMAESASRKRESNGSAFPCPQSKYPRGHLPHTRNVPDTMGGLLVPPQLRGRSNVVTEDISKLFVRRNQEPKC